MTTTAASASANPYLRPARRPVRPAPPGWLDRRAEGLTARFLIYPAGTQFVAGVRDHWQIEYLMRYEGSVQAAVAQTVTHVGVIPGPTTPREAIECLRCDLGAQAGWPGELHVRSARASQTYVEPLPVPNVPGAGQTYAAPGWRIEYRLRTARRYRWTIVAAPRTAEDAIHWLLADRAGRCLQVQILRVGRIVAVDRQYAVPAPGEPVTGAQP